MEHLLYNISQVLGITIIHSLWQGLIIYIVLRLFVLILPAMSAAIKYWVSYGALTVTLGWFLITLFKQLDQYNWLSTTELVISPLTFPAMMQEVKEPANRLYFAIARFMPYLTMLYVVGLVFNTLKLTLAWNSIYRIRQNVKDAGFENTVKRLSAKLNITKNVQAAFSEWVDVPCVTGFIKPIILLPVSITCYLSTDEIEAILLHELAHIKRNDYLLNFIQQVMGILLFFNPFARLVTKVINEERENCCDDTVVQVTGSPFLYAQALLKLEENKQQQWQLALAATGKKYELLNRIERIMKTKTHTINIRPVLITVLALICGISSIAWLNPEIKNGKVIIKNAPAIRAVTAAITGSTEAPKAVIKRKKKIYTESANPDLNDTTKKKYKIVVEDENGNKTEYGSVSELPAADKNDFIKSAADAKLNALLIDTANLNKTVKAYMKQFDTPEWRKQQKKLVETSLAMTKQFNTPAFKRQQQKMIEQSLAMASKFNTPEFKKNIDAMAKAGTLMTNYKEHPEFAKNIENMVKYYSTPEFAKDMEKVAKYYDSPEFEKALTEAAKYNESDEYKKMISGMTQYYDSPEFRKSIKELTKYYDSPAFKSQMGDLQKMAEEMAKKMGEAWSKEDRQKEGYDVKISDKEFKEEQKKQSEEIKQAKKEMEKDLKKQAEEMKQAKKEMEKELKKTKPE